MIRFLSAAVTLLTAITLSLTSAHAVENTWDYSVQVSSAVQTSPAKITLSWPQDTNGTPSSYTIYRKAPTDSSWGSGTTIAGGNTTYTDTSVTPGTAYEYRIVKAAGSYTGYGYITTGIQAPLVDNRGKLILLVDNSMAGPLASELARLQQDLAGDGWTVLRHDVSRTDPVASVKALITADYNADPANVKSVFLFGHVPVPYSGQFNPDGHPDHVGAWPADAFYGDIDGNWTDNSVNYVQNINTDPVDAARITNVPGDGKFDQSDIPSTIELQVGRVDLANMPARKEWGGAATLPSETELLRKYLNKDHAFRTHAVNPPRRAILGDYFGARGGEAFAASGFRSFAPLVGANNIRNLNTEYNDQKGVWIPQAAQNDYLLAYACGAGSYDAISGIGNTGLYNGGTTYDLTSANVHGTFNLIFGSWLGDWDHEDNMLRAPLATDYGLVSVWSGRPHWFLHPMGLGETIGAIARMTQNNVNTYETQINSAAHRTHIALMGDPTLRLHPVVPAGSVNGSVNGGSVALTWGASNDSDLVGYHVYRATSANGPFTRLTGSPVNGTSYTDASAPAGATYMVRAVKLESTTSGSYYNAAQGVFWSAATGSSGGDNTPAPATDTNAPTVSVTSPSSGATVFGPSVTVTAAASDDTGVVGVQLKLDGANLGAEITQPPFSTTFDASRLSNGAHTLGAVARDAAGNMTGAGTVNITVNNPVASTDTPSGGSTTPTPSTGGSSQPTTPTDVTGPTAAATNGSLAADLGSGATVWIDDDLPAGAGGVGSTVDSWNWVTDRTFSGSKAHRSDAAGGLHEHWFGWSNTPLIVNQGEVLFTYVYIDPANVPSQIMLSWSTSSSWEHRAYWGADRIGRGAGEGYYYAGPMPAAGQWVRLEVPASAVGLDTSIVTAMGFSAFDGSVTWDASGKMLRTAPSIPVTSGTTPAPSTDALKSKETIWFDDALPAGAGGLGSSVDTWDWVTSNPTPISGSKAHKSALASGKHEHWFGWANNTLAVKNGDTLFAYVYLDPANPPSEIMLSWSTSSSWNHRAYWGTDKLGMGSGAGYYRAGDLPAAGQWVRLEVPASAIAMEGQAATAMNFTLVDGAATWDKTGTLNTAASTTGWTLTGTSSGGSTSTSGGTTTTTTSTSGGTSSGGSTSGSTSTSGGTTSGGTSSGSTTTTPTTSTTPTTATNEVSFFDDDLPIGAGGMGTVLDTWNWVSSPTISGAKAHKSDLASGQHEHWFGWASLTLPVVSGDTLYTYVYLDPANPPTELMVSWSTSSSWEHRAYWGANKIDRGSGPGRFYAGALPETGKWVRLEVPASAVGLEGSAVTAMGFSLYDGAATWDKTGKYAGAASSTGWSIPGTGSNSGGSTSGGSTTPTQTTTPTTSSDTLWIDDSLPNGAGGVGTNVDSWNWISSPAPFSGSKAHQSAAASGLHEHWFGWSNSNLPIATGDKLITYVYLDPANTPSEIMLSWSTNSSWEHRAYWGADKIGRGTGQGHYYAGPLPAAGQWVRLEVPANAVGLEGDSVTAMNFSLYDGAAAWDASGKSGSTSSSGGSTSGGSTTPTPTSGGSSSGGSSSGSTTTTPTPSTSDPSIPSGGTSGTPVVTGENVLARIPQVGDYELRVLTPTVLELRRILAKPADPTPFAEWNFVDSNGNFNAPATSQFAVTANGQAINVSAIGFRRIAAFGQLYVRDLRVEASLYLTLSSPIADGAAVEVKNPNGSLWNSGLQFKATADALRFNPAIHVNQEGYVPSFTKKAMVGYYLGNQGELNVDASQGFKLVNAATGVTVFTGSLTHRVETGYETSPVPYQKVYEADFTSFTTPGEYQLVVPGMGASLPFLINDGVAMAFTRTYELGLYHQRCGGSNELPYTRFTHAACHLGAAEVPTADSAYDFTWKTISNYSGGNSTQTAPQLNSAASQLYPFVNQGKIDVSGGHHDAGDYSKYTIDVALLAHQLMFTADSIKGTASLDNLGIPESGDGISDIMQEGKWEADYLAKLQDADGGFYFIVYPKNREYEGDVSPEFGDQQVVWPKNTSATAASVAVLAEFASSPLFKKTYPDVAASYLAKAKLGWQFLMNAHAKYGKVGAYQKVTFYGDEFNDNDELAWTAAAMFVATGDAQYAQKLKEWYPNPADPSTVRWNWQRCYQGYGGAVRDYAFAVRSGRLSASQIDPAYLAACEGQITAWADDILGWTKASAYGTSFPLPSRHYMQAGWFISLDQASDMAVAYQINAKQDYVNAIIENMNYEAGSNPVNVSFLAGLGVRRPQQMVSQYRNTNRHLMPPIGEPMSNVHNSFAWLTLYGSELSAMSFPNDGGSGTSYPLQDRFSDIWNVTTEFITLNQGRALTSTAFLATLTDAKSTPWKPTTTLKIMSSGSATIGQPITLSVDTAGLDLTGARITWEAQDQRPDFGSTYQVTPKASGANWAEVEITWPDGRRLFGTGTFNVQ